MGDIQNTPNITEIMNLYGDDILRVCLLYLKDYHLAEDTTQETFIKVYQKLDTFNGKSSLKTWITSIAINNCKNALHRTKRETLSWDELEVPYSEDFSKGETSTIVSREVANLPQKYLEVVTLYYYQELNIKEISQVLKVPQATVKTRLKRAKERLRTHLKEELFYE
jgi:RNA polymerase sigma-70 factor (ECF subfamily)